MFGVFFLLSVLSSFGQERLVDAIVDALRPATAMIARFLPIFYAPCLVVLPLVVSSAGFGSVEYVKIFVLLLCGVPFSLFLTALVVSTARVLAKVEPLPVEYVSNVNLCSKVHAIVIGFMALLGILGAAFAPGKGQHVAATLFLVAATASGMLLEIAPAAIQMLIPHPALSCLLNGIAGCGILAAVTGTSFLTVQEQYLQHTSSIAAMGAGDWLMRGLGPLLLSFGVHMYKQRLHLFRHCFELLVGAAVASLGSLTATTGAAHLLGLQSNLAMAIAPRSITLPLALPIAERLGLSDELLSITGACVTTTALIGGAMVVSLLKVSGVSDPVVRGFSAGSAALGMGPATLAKVEATSLPFAALGYGLVGIFGSLWVEMVPGVITLLQAIAGV